MKTVYISFYLCAFFCLNTVFAQEEFENELLFPHFKDGIVVFKDGTRFPTLLNYSLFQQEMLFQNLDGAIMAVANPHEILVVIIGNRLFFPVTDKIFYEEIQAGMGSFFVQHKSSMLSEGKLAGYGGFSATNSIAVRGTYHDSEAGSFEKLNLNERFQLINSNIYYLKSVNGYKKFSSAKSLGKLFKGQESKIEKFAKEKGIDFSKTDDITRIVEYCFSLTVK